MDQSFTSTSRMDLSHILASPSTSRDSKVKFRLDQMDRILKNMNSCNTVKVDIGQINKEAKMRAKKCFLDEIEDSQLIQNLPKFDDMFGFNKICSQINRALKKRESIFKNEPFLMFKKEDLYDGKKYDEKLMRAKLLDKGDKLKMFKAGMKMISVESDLENILAIKKVLIDEMICVSIVDVYASLIKILINNGINLELLKRYVIKYQNIKDNPSLALSKPKEADHENDALNITQSFIHVVDLVEISVDTIKILDHQILADYVAIILILFSEQSWRIDLSCLTSLAHLLAIVLNRTDNSKLTIKVISKTITKFFKNKHSMFFEFIDFFPDNTNNLTNLKFALCKTWLNQYQIKIGHNKESIDSTFDRLNELKSSNSEEIKLVLALVDHFFRARELSGELSQQISNRLASFVGEYEFDEENQNSIEFKAYMDSLIEQYDRKPKAASAKRKKVKGEYQGRPRKITVSEKEVKKIWEELESEVDFDE